jgi:alpha-beta hydrolase superfamily lysophospholipase
MPYACVLTGLPRITILDGMDNAMAMEPMCPDPRPEYFRGIDGQRLVGERWGASADLLYLHGFGQTRQAWARTAAHLAAAGFGGLALDGRGHGESDWNAAEHAYSMEQFIADIDTVAAGQPSRPVLVGASMGGLLGLRDSRARRLRACSAPWCWSTSPRAGKPRAWSASSTFMAHASRGLH